MTLPSVNKNSTNILDPLLPHLSPRATTNKENVSSSASVPGAVFNVSTSIIGAGIMSVPATLKVLGVIPAFMLIVLVAVLTDVSVEFLLRFTKPGDSTTYSGVMSESFGRAGSVLVQLSVLVANLGCLIIFLIIIGDVLSGSQHGDSMHSGVLQEWFGIHWWNSRPSALLFIVIVVLLPLVLFRRVESLRFASAVSVFLALVFVVISMVLALTALVHGETQSPRLVPELNSQGGSFFSLFTAFPVIVTAFTFHFNVHPIGIELAKPSDMALAVRFSLVLCAGIYFAVGFFGYLLFGDSIMPDILVNFDRSSSDPGIISLLNVVVRLSYALHLVLVFPLLNFSLRANIDEFLFPNKPPSPLARDDSLRFVSVTSILLAFTYLAAIAIPNIWYFFQFIGSTAAVSLAFIFPAAITIRDVHGISTKKDRIIAWIMVILAVVTSLIAISTNVYNFWER